MTELQERLEKLELVARLDHSIRFLKRRPDALEEWAAADREWFAKLLEPLPARARVESRLAPSSASDIAHRATMLGALLQEFDNRDGLDKEIEALAGLWSRLRSDAALTSDDASLLMRLASMLRRYLLESPAREGVGGVLARRTLAA
jgi:predicted nucleic acid-binding Zn ribbon protein